MLHIDTLTRRFGDHTALDGVSLTVPQGKVACIVGPSGCGKSTLLRQVSGLDRPDGGEIRLGDTLLSAPGWALDPRKRRLNMVFQDYALWPHMRVEKIVGYGLRHLPRSDRAARVERWLDRLQIAPLARRLPSQISGGQQQRVAIARALATEPDVLLFDEPLSNLDVQLRIEMRREFARLFADLGRTVLYVTHDPLEASAFADILVVMKNGRIEQMGAPEALFAQPSSEWIATLAGYDLRLQGQVGGGALTIAGQRVPMPREDLAPGPVTVMLRSAECAFVDPVDGVLCGEITDSLYEGTGWRAELDLGQGQRAGATVPMRPRTGDRVGLSTRSMLIFERQDDQ